MFRERKLFQTLPQNRFRAITTFDVGLYPQQQSDLIAQTHCNAKLELVHIMIYERGYMIIKLLMCQVQTIVGCTANRNLRDYNYKTNYL